jgi:hypothetical protein
LDSDKVDYEKGSRGKRQKAATHSDSDSGEKKAENKKGSRSKKQEAATHLDSDNVDSGEGSKSKKQKAASSSKVPSTAEEVNPSDEEGLPSVERVVNLCIESRRNFFQQLATNMDSCRSYDELVALCMAVDNEVKQYPISYQIDQTVFNVCRDEDIDTYANLIMPFDIPGNPFLYAMSIYGDGNCFSRSGSVIAFSNQSEYVEIRARIVLELVQHENLYLDPSYLAAGHEDRLDYAEKYAVCSETYVSEQVEGNREVVKELYQKEVFAFRRSGVYAGMWEMHALANVLKVNIFSVYPMYGFNVRNENHRLVPSKEESAHLAYVMWSDASEETDPMKWRANHFVILLELNTRKDRY